jgi:hypothetical protein
MLSIDYARLRSWLFRQIVEEVRDGSINWVSGGIIGHPIVGGWELLLHSTPLGDLRSAPGDIDPNHIDDYYYNPEDGNWYSSPPEPDYGQYGWFGQADEKTQAELDALRQFAFDWEAGKVGYFDGFSKPTFNNQDPSSAFGSAKQQGSPIVIDLDGDGIETLSQDANVYFDLDNNGMAEQTGWVGNDDGLLVLDKNGDGEITNGNELFGNHTKLADGTDAVNGYQALSELDTNSDGLINQDDESYANLRVWQDANGDGLSQESELHTLQDLGIASLTTGYTDTSIDDGNSNTIKQTSTATLTNGDTIDTADVWFSVNKTQTVDREVIELSEEILALPDAEAFGNVKRLHNAMALNPVLMGLIQDYVNSPKEERPALLDSIIYEWAGVSDVEPSSYDEYGSVYRDGRRVAALEEAGRVSGA